MTTGTAIVLDRSGWTKRDGTDFVRGSVAVSSVEGAPWKNLDLHLARLQRHYVPVRAALNIFLFVGPNDKAEDASANLAAITRRNGGTFQLLTTKRLEELIAGEEAAAAN